MKKVFALFIMFILLYSLFGCTNTAGNENGGQAAISTGVSTNYSGNQVINPVKDSTAAEILNTLGIKFNIPGDAQNIQYFIIGTNEGNPIAQAKFTKNDIEYTYRICSAAAFKDISGAYYNWTTVKNIQISYCNGEVRYIEGEQGICLWFDTVPGLMYCIYADSGASEGSLLSLANELYVPARDAP